MLLGLAHQMYKAGNYKQALEHSNVVYERCPLRTDNLLLLGAIYYQVIVLLLVLLSWFDLANFCLVVSETFSRPYLAL